MCKNSDQDFAWHRANAALGLKWVFCSEKSGEEFSKLTANQQVDLLDAARPHEAVTLLMVLPGCPPCLRLVVLEQHYKIRLQLPTCLTVHLHLKDVPAEGGQGDPQPSCTVLAPKCT